MTDTDRQHSNSCDWRDYTDKTVIANSGAVYRVIIDTELDSDPFEVRIYKGNDDEPLHRIPLV